MTMRALALAAALGAAAACHDEPRSLVVTAAPARARPAEFAYLTLKVLGMT
jgi:hypothetical protein